MVSANEKSLDAYPGEAGQVDELLLCLVASDPELSVFVQTCGIYIASLCCQNRVESSGRYPRNLESVKIFDHGWFFLILNIPVTKLALITESESEDSPVS